jgi:hypothetical protein
MYNQCIAILSSSQENTMNGPTLPPQDMSISRYSQATMESSPGVSCNTFCVRGLPQHWIESKRRCRPGLCANHRPTHVGAVARRLPQIEHQANHDPPRAKAQGGTPRIDTKPPPVYSKCDSISIVPPHTSVQTKNSYIENSQRAHCKAFGNLENHDTDEQDNRKACKEPAGINIGQLKPG